MPQGYIPVPRFGGLFGSSIAFEKKMPSSRVGACRRWCRLRARDQQAGPGPKTQSSRRPCRLTSTFVAKSRLRHDNAFTGDTLFVVEIPSNGLTRPEQRQGSREVYERANGGMDRVWDTIAPRPA